MPLQFGLSEIMVHRVADAEGKMVDVGKKGARKFELYEAGFDRALQTAYLIYPTMYFPSHTVNGPGPWFVKWNAMRLKAEASLLEWRNSR